MNTQLSNYLILFFLFLFSSEIKSQENFTSSGTDIKTENGAVSYTLGQLFYSYNAGYSGSETQGIQQTFEISLISTIESENSIVINAHPNPVHNSLSVKIHPFKNSYALKLYSIEGNLLQSKKITEEQTIVDFQHLPVSGYIMKIHDNSIEIKSFKIVKK